jgi:hypothetical protein
LLAREHAVQGKKQLGTIRADPNVLEQGQGIEPGQWRYYCRVVASDRPSNLPALARDAELGAEDADRQYAAGCDDRRTQRAGNVEMNVDRWMRLLLCGGVSYSIHAGSWVPVEAADGVTDAPHETFHISLDNLRAGERLIVVRVYDTANNAGLAKVVVRQQIALRILHKLNN